MPCSWWEQKLHSRRRWADVEVMWPSLRARADTLADARVAWDVFLGQQGQEHWQCECGTPIVDLFKTLVVNVEE